MVSLQDYGNDIIYSNNFVILQFERGSLLEESGSITYDETEERVRYVIREEDNGQEIDAFEVIVLYSKVQCNFSLLTDHIVTYNTRMWSIVMITELNCAKAEHQSTHLDHLVSPKMPPHTDNTILAHQVIPKQACWLMFLVVKSEKVKLV